MIDEEVSALLRRGRTSGPPPSSSTHRDALDRLVEDLLAHETVDGDAVEAAITGDGRPTGPADSGGPAPPGAVPVASDASAGGAGWLGRELTGSAQAGPAPRPDDDSGKGPVASD